MTPRGYQRKKKEPLLRGGLKLGKPGSQLHLQAIKEYEESMTHGGVRKTSSHTPSTGQPGSASHLKALDDNDEAPSQGGVSRRNGKAIAEEESSDSEPDELPQLISDKKNPNWSKEKVLPRCPTPSRMFNWSAEDYERYDEYLIAKFNAIGFSKSEKIYVRKRDPNSRVARVARAIYRKWGKEF